MFHLIEHRIENDELRTRTDDLLADLERRGFGRRATYVIGSAIETVPRTVDRAAEMVAGIAETTAETWTGLPSGGWNCTSTGVPGCISPRGLSLAPLALRSIVWQRTRRLPDVTQAVHDTPARE